MRSPKAPDQATLATLNEDGTRHWLAPKLSPGHYFRRRRIVAWALILVFGALPYIFINGKPSILLDLPAREFTFFGITLLATDTVMLMLFMVTLFLSVFLATALLGRVWCGWACPQTVYMEFIFRPLERLVMGKGYRRGIDKRAGGKRFVLYGLYLMVALFLAHMFLSYFVGVEQLWTWIGQSPFDHPASFIVMAAITIMVMIDFVYFREQMCTIACPYGRFQSVLLDRQSLIVGYDADRGEPRGKPKDGSGDCIDCKACVVTCPTGIDIRQGLQMECIACTQCIDACDVIMEKLNKPAGLIRYTNEDELAGKERRRFFRVRTIIYMALLTALVTALTLSVVLRSEADITVLRDPTAPYQVLPDGEIASNVRVKIVNRTEERHSYTVSLPGLDGARLASGNNPLDIEPSATGVIHLVVIVPKASYGGMPAVPVEFVITNEGDFNENYPYRLLGP